MLKSLPPFQVTDYPPTPFKRAQQATLHLSRNPNASASAFFRTQLAIQQQQQLALAAPLTPPPSTNPNTGELVKYTPPQAITYPQPMPAIMQYPQQQVYSMVSQPLSHLKHVLTEIVANYG